LRLTTHSPPHPWQQLLQTVSRIGLAQPGRIMRGVSADQCERHLHQLHVCMPSKKGQTRLLYRMSMDFMGWVRHVPGIDRLWKSVAAQVCGRGRQLWVLLGPRSGFTEEEAAPPKPTALPIIN
jgi:hypothetical protein